MRRPLLIWIALIFVTMVPIRADEVVLDLNSAQFDGELRGAVELYTADRGNLERFHRLPSGDKDRLAKKRFYESWASKLDKVDFQKLSHPAQIDWLLLRHQIRYELRELGREAKRDQEAQPFTPFADSIASLEIARREIKPVNSAQAADLLDRLSKELEALKIQINTGILPKGVGAQPKSTVAFRISQQIEDWRRVLSHWYEFYHGYDPQFTWWVQAPYNKYEKQLQEYANLIRTKFSNTTLRDPDAIVGDPIGREALLSDLEHEWIPYSPEDLMAIANREFAWCDQEMRRAARDLGFGDDWKKALEHVKTKHVEPGQQPLLIRKLADEAVQFLDTRELVTIPEVCRNTWRIEMMSPARQKVNPFFLGGESITVSFPTDTMDHQDKLMSMRGNNVHFSRATVHHELIPGHHLQGYMAKRYRPHRQHFETPFLVEGWALHWEMLLWDLKFPQSAEDRVGMLFWRSHRCARIIFSLGVHLETMTPQEAIDFLVNRVGHERANATAEVRRSFGGAYSPLYQCAYMLGGLQIRHLHEDLVKSGKMTNREFHDAILKQNAIPIELIRAALTNQKLDRNFAPSWKFAGDQPGQNKN